MTWNNLVITSKFEKPACFNQEVKLTGGSNNFFGECLKGLQNVIDFINLKRTRHGYVMLNEEMDGAVKASTPLMMEVGRNYFNAVDCDIPTDLPAYLPMHIQAAKKKARYTSENNVLFTRRALESKDSSVKSQGWD
jgi:hypothetical protein